MSIAIVANNNTKTMSSVEIAELTGKNHSHVRRDIVAMLESLGFGEEGVSSFGQSYLDSQGKRQPCFYLPHDETICLLTGYDAKARMAVIKRWQELEALQSIKVPTTLSGALRLAAEQAETIEAHALQLEAAKPAIEMVDRYVEAKSSKCLSDVAKILGHKPQSFIQVLSNDEVIFKRSGSWVPYQHHIDAGRFTVKAGESNGHAFHQTRVEPKGIEWLARSYGVPTSDIKGAQCAFNSAGA